MVATHESNPAEQKKLDTYTLTVRCTNCLPDGKPWQIEIPMGQLWQNYARGGSRAGYGPPQYRNDDGPGFEGFIQVFCPRCKCPTVVRADKPLEPTIADNATVQEEESNESK